MKRSDQEIRASEFKCKRSINPERSGRDRGLVLKRAGESLSTAEWGTEMQHAYDEDILDYAMNSIGEMMEYTALDLHIPAGTFYSWFLVSGIADRFGSGETRYTEGMSGVELAREVILRTTRQEEEAKPSLHMNKGPEYWAGWAVAYYQWYRAVLFRSIEQAVPFTDIMQMYHPYHEMDITQFADEMDLRMKKNQQESMLRRLRKYAALTQKELAAKSGVPLRTIQQYEQGQKEISRAAAETVDKLSRALYCSPEDITG